MANRELALYTSSNSTFNLGEIPQPVNPTAENTYVERKHMLLQWLHSGASGGTSMRSMARTKAP